MLQQLKTNLSLHNDFSDSRDAPHSVEDVARTQQRWFEFASSAHRHYVVHELMDNDRRAQIPFDYYFEQLEVVEFRIDLDLDLLVIVKQPFLVLGKTQPQLFLFRSLAKGNVYDIHSNLLIFFVKHFDEILKMIPFGCS
jgi:hypothetical protein